MSNFWVGICFALLLIVLAAFVAAQLLPERRGRGDPIPVASKIAGYLFASSVIAVVWAICFRPQIEKRQFSLLALGALIAMEAALFWYIRAVGTYGP